MDINSITLLILITSWAIIFIIYFIWAYYKFYNEIIFYFGILLVIALQTFGYLPQLYSNWNFYISSWIAIGCLIPIFEGIYIRKAKKIGAYESVSEVFLSDELRLGIITIIESYHSFLISLWIFWIPNEVGLFSVIWILIFVNTLILILHYARENLTLAFKIYLPLICEAFLISYLWKFSSYMDLTSFFIVFFLIIGVAVITAITLKISYWYNF